MSWQSASPPETLQAYVQLYLKEEIQAEALVRNLPGFARFLPTAALFHGQVLNVAGLARDAGVARTTVVGYLEILADTHLAWLLPAYEGRLRVRERKHPKLYWADPGVMRALKQELHPPGELERGSLLEGWVATLLKAYAVQGGGEVDFLVARGGEFTAIEVKARKVLASGDFAGLQAIGALAGLRRRLVVFLGERPFETEAGIEALPVGEFLRELEAGRV